MRGWGLGVRIWNLTQGSLRREEPGLREREFLIDNLLVRIHLIIVMIRWTGLTPCEFEFPFPGSLTSTLRDVQKGCGLRFSVCGFVFRGLGVALE